MNKVFKISSLALAVSFAGNVIAAKGELPNGKPFQQLQAQIDSNTSLIEANAQAIVTLGITVDQLNIKIGEIDATISYLEGLIAENSADISVAMVRIMNLEEDTETLFIELSAVVERHDADMQSITSQLSSIELAIAELNNLRIALAQDLNQKLSELKLQVDSNTADIQSIIIDLLSVNAELTSINSMIADLKDRQELLEQSQDLLAQALEQLSDRVENLDARLISVEVGQVQKSCSAIKNQNPSATSGFYTIDPDPSDDVEAIQAYCDMDSFGGGWTNLDFQANKLLLDNGHEIQCSVLEQSANGITCQAPLFNNGGYLYHYRCDGTDNSANYLLDHVGMMLGHKDSPAMGFSGVSQRYTGVHGVSTSAQDEYLYIDGNLYHWSSPEALPYSQGRNGNCVPGFFTLTL